MMHFHLFRKIDNNGNEQTAACYNEQELFTGPVTFTNGEICYFFKSQKIDCTSQEEFNKYLKMKAFW